jgi:hypothetical protein
MRMRRTIELYPAATAARIQYTAQISQAEDTPSAALLLILASHPMRTRRRARPIPPAQDPR